MRHYRGPIFLPQVAHAIGSSDPRTAPNLPSSPATAITAASLTETGITLWNWRPTIATTPRWRTPSAISSTAGAQPSPLGPLRCQRRLAGRAGYGPQSSTLDPAHRSGRGGGDHQDPPTTLLLHRRTPHFAAAPGLGLAESVQSRPGTIACAAIPGLTAWLAPDLSTRLLNRVEDSRQVGPRASLATCCPDNLTQHHHYRPPACSWRGYRSVHSAISIGIKPPRLFPLPLISCLPDMATSLRWIRDKDITRFVHQTTFYLIDHITNRSASYFSVSNSGINSLNVVL